MEPAPLAHASPIQSALTPPLPSLVHWTVQKVLGWWHDHCVAASSSQSGVT